MTDPTADGPDTTCDQDATEQYLFVGLHDGLNHISVPLCADCSEGEQPAETIAVYDLDENVRQLCRGLEDPPWDRCMCHPTRGKPKECQELRCEHPVCSHGRPHCPVCPVPGSKRPARSARCAACSGGPPVHGESVCQLCLERGIDANELFAS